MEDELSVSEGGCGKKGWIELGGGGSEFALINENSFNGQSGTGNEKKREKEELVQNNKCNSNCQNQKGKQIP